MFFRIKPSGERRYLQIVENSRDGAATRYSKPQVSWDRHSHNVGRRRRHPER